MKKKFDLWLVIFALGVSLSWIVAGRFNLSKVKEKLLSGQSCVLAIEKKAVQGGSLSGLVEDGQEVKIWRDYYKCRPVRRNDIVVYYFAGNSEPLIKIVKGISGDTFFLRQDGEARHIILNGEVVKNSEGEPYQVSEQGNRLLSLYIRDYQGVIPANTYLLLGNIANGSLDSTRFGLVSGRDITAKVVKVIK